MTLNIVKNAKNWKNAVFENGFRFMFSERLYKYQRFIHRDMRLIILRRMIYNSR